MNILQIGTTDNKGGAALVSWSLQQELRKQNHTLNMIVGYKRSTDPGVREIFDTPINRIISKIIGRNLRARLHYHFGYHFSNDISLLPGKKVKKYPEFKQADIIHAHNLHSLFFNLKVLPSLSHKKPFVWTLHDMWALTGHEAYALENMDWVKGGIKEKLPNTLPPLKSSNTDHLWRLKKKIYNKSRLHIVVPSQWLLNQVNQSILKECPVTLIYNGINADVFKPSKDKNALRKKMNLPTDKKIILVAGKDSTRNPWKGWKYSKSIITNSQKRDDLLFLVLGGQKTMGDIKNTQALPYTSDRHTLADYYATSDLLLYPSIADNCPLTVLEAMGCGLPVLTFDTGGIPELITHKSCGYIARYKDKDDLLNGFNFLLNLPSTEMNTMQNACRQRVLKKFTIPIMTDQYLALYKKILKTQKKYE